MRSPAPLLGSGRRKQRTSPLASALAQRVIHRAIGALESWNRPPGHGLRRAWNWLGSLLVLALIAYAYGPSLRHGPRADQWTYLTETLGEYRFADVVAHTWSYSRTRMINPGDTQLYRPLLFVLLAVEKTLFGNDFLCWQATGVVLHSLVSLLLFLILRRIRALTVGADAARSVVDALPLVLTIFFATNFAILEQVIWSHIAGYLVLTALILTSLWLLLELIAEPEPSRVARSCCWRPSGC